MIGGSLSPVIMNQEGTIRAWEVITKELTNLKRRFALLTPRECEVLSHVVRGRLNKQIAFESDISERTVKAHRRQVMEKMEVDSLAELLRISGKLDIQPFSHDYR